MSLGPTSYDLPAASAETHLSVLTFVGDRVYKLKKAVDVGFVDLTTRAERERICHREVELNRRLAPDVYLGVIDLVGDDGPFDHMVAMRRMPVELRLSTLVEDGDPRADEQVRTIARLLADFHSRAERSSVIDEAGTAEAVLALWEDNLAGIEPFVDQFLDREVHERIAELARRYIEGRHDVFATRIAGGHIVDGHGDLQAADIFCLDDGPRILDCIEFNDRFRHGDAVADIAFLAMDLERLGAPDLARAFLDAYGEFTAEHCPRSLVEHYVAYRAHVRAKVNCLRAGQASGDERDRAIAEANRLLYTTARWLEAARVRLVLVGGAPGTGKTTVAREIGAAMGWPVLSSDAVRDELFARTGPAAPDEGRYAPDDRRAVYEELLSRARVALTRGESVVLDATWNEGEMRALARTAGVESSADVIELRCVVAPEIAEARVTERLAGGADASEATAEIAARLSAAFDQWDEAVLVDTSADAAATARVTLSAVTS